MSSEFYRVAGADGRPAYMQRGNGGAPRLAAPVEEEDPPRLTHPDGRGSPPSFTAAPSYLSYQPEEDTML